MAKEITQDMILQKMELMQKDCPEMFSHPGANKNEICLGYYAVDFAMANVMSFQTAGLFSARLDKNYPEKSFVMSSWRNDQNKLMQKKLETVSYPIFADAEQFIRLELAMKED